MRLGIYKNITKTIILFVVSMEQHALKIVNNCLNSNIYFYLETEVVKFLICI